MEKKNKEVCVRLEAEFKRDMYNNYMIFKEIESIEDSYYGLKMVLHNEIPNLLKMDIRVLDNMKYYYYNITGKHAISLLCEKEQLKKEQLTMIISGILKGIEKAGEYLLREDDFVIEPEYIYLDLLQKKVYLCYMAGYQQNIRKQLSQLMEYLMDKVDYKEEAAVLLSYSLYKISKNEDCTLDMFRKALEQKENVILADVRHEDRKNISIEEKIELEETNQKEETRQKEETNQKEEQLPYKKKKIHTEIPVLEERVESQEEVQSYSVKTILFCVISVLISVIIAIAISRSGILNNPISETLNIKKAIFVILLIGVGEAYILHELLKPKHKIAKIRSRTEYFNPSVGFEDEEEYNIKDNNYLKKENQYKDSNSQQKSLDSLDKELNYQPKDLWNQKKELSIQYKNLDSSNNNLKNQNKHLEYLDRQYKDLNYQYRDLNGEKADFNIIKKRVEDEANIEKNHQEKSKEYSESAWDIEEQKTMLLGEVEKEKSNIYLKSLQTEKYQDIHLLEFPFFIGKLKTQVDSAIENSTISRYHAKIEQKQEQYYITDLNSTNGTYVNHIRIDQNKPIPIKQDDVISFSNISYIFIQN